ERRKSCVLASASPRDPAERCDVDAGRPRSPGAGQEAAALTAELPLGWAGQEAYPTAYNGSVNAISFGEARETVMRTVRSRRSRRWVEEATLDAAAGRVLAEDIRADRDTPALARSVRDGFAVRAIDLPGTLDVIGEVRAGERFAGAVGPRQA